MKVFFVRHSKIEPPLSVCYGQTDFPLAHGYERDLEQLQERVAGVSDDGIKMIISSPLVRCLQLAQTFRQMVFNSEQIVGGRNHIVDKAQVTSAKPSVMLRDSCNDIPLVVDDRLKEFYYGRWENCHWDTIAQKYAKDYRLWVENPSSYPATGGESYQLMKKRVICFVQDYFATKNTRTQVKRKIDSLLEQEQLGSGDILIFTHVGVIRCVLAYLLNLRFSEIWDYRIDYGEVIVCEVLIATQAASPPLRLIV